MGIHEMHIAIDIWLQKMNSNSRRDIVAEEKDFILNSVINDFVNQKIRKNRSFGDYGFEEDEVDAESLSSLLVQFKRVSVFPSKSEDYFLEVRLPADFRNFISFQAVTAPVHCMTSEEKLLPKTVENTVYLYVFKITLPTSEGPFYTELNLEWGETSTIKKSQGTSDPLGSKFIFNAIKSMEELPSDIIDIYWEKYPNRFPQKDTIVIKSNTNLEVNPSIRFDNTAIIATKVTLTENMIATHPYNTTFSAISRRIKSQYISVIQDSSFERSTFKNLVLAIEDTKLLIPNDETFIVTIGALSYIKKPAEVSLSLGIDCDLPEETHNYICSKAAEEMLMTIDSPLWNSRFETNKIKK